jgi:hypothetical protein
VEAEGRVSREQHDPALVRIRVLLDASSGQDWAFVPRPCLAESDLLAWEAEYGVALPAEYRLFLHEIGDGGVMPGSYCDFNLFALAGVRGAPTAARPFPVSAARVQARFRQLVVAGRPEDGVLFPELEPIWEADDVPPGCIVFGHYPSYDSLFLATAGDLRGSLWCGVCYGIPETKGGEFVGFLDWFAEVLAEFEGGA